MKLSLPSPPTTVRLASEAGDTDCAMPSIVTTTFVPSKAALIVCAPESDAVRVSEAGAAAGRSVAGAGGGDRPLAVFAFGSGVGSSMPAGRGRRAVGLRRGVVAGDALPPEPLEPLPVTPAMPVVEPAPGPSPDWPDWRRRRRLRSGRLGRARRVGRGHRGRAVAPVDVEVADRGDRARRRPLGADTEVLPDPPTTDVSTGGAGGAVVRVRASRTEIVPDCGAETVDVSDDEICVPVESSAGVGAGSFSTARKRGGRRRSGSVGVASPAGLRVGGRGVSAGAAGAAGASAPQPEPSRPAVAPALPTVSDTAGVDWKRSTGVFVRAIPVAVPTSE